MSERTHGCARTGDLEWRVGDRALGPYGSGVVEEVFVDRPMVMLRYDESHAGRNGGVRRRHATPAAVLEPEDPADWFHATPAARAYLLAFGAWVAAGAEAAPEFVTALRAVTAAALTGRPLARHEAVVNATDRLLRGLVASIRLAA